ncbi:MAG: Ig-like domain-containing protein, partial [Ekhidna sp.]|nr:Ig-like domain-containing protein [Ekhidna sp.]
MKNTVLLLLTFFLFPGCNDDEQTDKQDNESPKVIDTTAPTAPVIDLEDGSDTGRANDDNITSDRTPTFTITNYEAVIDADDVSVKWFIDDVEQAGETGATFTTPELSDGTYAVHARYTDASGNFTNSEALAVTIDATAPTAPVIDLDDASDTGMSDDDNITSDRTPTFTITNY